MVAGVEYNHFLRTDAFSNSHKFVIRGTDLDFASFPFFALLNQHEMVLLGFVNCMDRYLNGIGNLLDKNSNLSRHTSSDFLRRIQYFHDHQILFNSRSPRAALLSIFIHLDHLTEKLVCRRPDVDLHRHTVANQRDPRLVNLRLDLHPCWVRQQEDGFLFLNENAGGNHEIITTAAALFICVDNLAICGCQDRASFNLRLYLPKLFFLFKKCPFVRV